MDRRRLFAVTRAVAEGAVGAGRAPGRAPTGQFPVADGCKRSGPERSGPERSGPERGVRTGLDRLVDSGWGMLAGQRLGVISNPTGVDREYRHLVDLMRAASWEGVALIDVARGSPETFPHE